MSAYATSSLYDSIANYPQTYTLKPQRGGFFKNTSVLSSTINLINNKKDFLVKVFANLLVQLGITFFVMEKFPVNELAKSATATSDKKNKNHSPFYTILLIAVIQFIIILVMGLVPMPMLFKLILFTIFSILAGIMLSFVRMITDPAIINVAILGVASIFSMMFLLGLFLLVSGVKFGFGVGFFLWFILLLFIIAQMVFMALNKYQAHVKLLSIFGILLFSIYILYDTNRILQKDYLGDFVTASMDYYLDIINLFLDLVNYQNS